MQLLLLQSNLHKRTAAMTTYSELMAQAQSLMVQAEQARQKEIASVIAEIKATMKNFGITIEDLDGRKRPKKLKIDSPAKYRGPNGELWTGGPGRRPEWVRAALAAGHSLDSYLI